jgi:hypothetical protein
MVVDYIQIVSWTSCDAASVTALAAPKRRKIARALARSALLAWTGWWLNEFLAEVEAVNVSSIEEGRANECIRYLLLKCTPGYVQRHCFQFNPLPCFPFQLCVFSLSRGRFSVYTSLCADTLHYSNSHISICSLAIMSLMNLSFELLHINLPKYVFVVTYLL